MEIFKSKLVREVIEWILYIAAAIAVGLFINTFIILNAYVPSGSMESTIMTGDNLWVNRLQYKFKNPERFDVVVFKYPDNEKELYIKRVIGLPGEKLEVKDGKVYINDAKVPLRDDFTKDKPLGDYGPFEIPAGHYFMMGDNRNNSQDSRFWKDKFVAKEKICGKAFFKYRPGFKVIK